MKLIRKLFYGNTRNGRMRKAAIVIMPLMLIIGFTNYIFGEDWYSYILYGLLAVSAYFGFFHRFK